MMWDCNGRLLRYQWERDEKLSNARHAQYLKHPISKWERAPAPTRSIRSLAGRSHCSISRDVTVDRWWRRDQHPQVPNRKWDVGCTPTHWTGIAKGRKNGMQGCMHHVETMPGLSPFSRASSLCTTRNRHRAEGRELEYDVHKTQAGKAGTMQPRVVCDGLCDTRVRRKAPSVRPEILGETRAGSLGLS